MRLLEKNRENPLKGRVLTSLMIFCLISLVPFGGDCFASEGGRELYRSIRNKEFPRAIELLSRPSQADLSGQMLLVSLRASLFSSAQKTQLLELAIQKEIFDVKDILLFGANYLRKVDAHFIRALLTGIKAPIPASLMTYYRGGPLSEIARIGGLEKFKVILEHPFFNFGEVDRVGDGPLSAALKAGRKEIVKFILNHEDLEIELSHFFSEDGNTQLHHAATHLDPKTFQILLDRSKLDLNLANDMGLTPLLIASQNRNSDLLAYLLDHPKITSAQILDPDENSPLHLAAQRSRLKNLKILVNSGKFEIDQKNAMGHTPAVEALLARSTHSLRFLLANGASRAFIHEKKFSETLEIVLKKEHYASLQVLIQSELAQEDIFALRSSLSKKLTAYKQAEQTTLMFQPEPGEKALKNLMALEELEVALEEISPNGLQLPPEWH